MALRLPDAMCRDCACVDSIARMLRNPRGRLRLFAASKAASAGLRELLPALDEAVAREAPGALHDAIAWNRDLLRDGRAVTVHCDGRLWVSWRREGGAASALLAAVQQPLQT